MRKMGTYTHTDRETDRTLIKLSHKLQYLKLNQQDTISSAQCSGCYVNIDMYTTGMSNLAPKLGQISPKWDKSGAF